MEIKNVFPPAGHVQDLHCSACNKHLDLTYNDFDEDVSGVRIRIFGLPVLHCAACNRDFLPDRSRFAIVRLHEDATRQGAPSVSSTRKKPMREYGFTKIPFIYDSDDYEYLPGLERPHNIGFLTPVFFSRSVLLKYDSLPNYRVKFASTTYGEISSEEFSISFGINKNGKVIMWLGDVAQLPESEQYYLRSENVASDHSIGSEFYDGQIDCVFTEPSREDALFSARSEFLEASALRFKTKIAHLDDEVIELAVSFNAPVADTIKDRRHVADTLNKIYLESLDNNALGAIMKSFGGDPKKLGSIKRLQSILTSIAPTGGVAESLSPFYVLYDFRVASSHLTSAEAAAETLRNVTKRLGLSETATLSEIYETLTDQLLWSLREMTSMVQSGKLISGVP